MRSTPIAQGWPASLIRRPPVRAQLETANREVAERIDHAIETIRGVLDGGE